MDYSKMSGYEINNRVHNIVVCEGKYDLTVEGYRVTWKDRKTDKEIVTLRKQYDNQFKDYLGSWADAGPIIEKHRIAIEPSKTNEKWAAQAEDWNYASSDKNPLRAAMIVYLMMHDKGEE